MISCLFLPILEPVIVYLPPENQTKVEKVFIERRHVLDLVDLDIANTDKQNILELFFD